MKMLFSIILFFAMTNTNPAKLPPVPDPGKAASDFKKRQMTFPRVRAAYASVWAPLQKALLDAHISSDFDMMINAYKKEGMLEIWLKPKGKARYQFFRSYSFCAHSGKLGPKVQEGDYQTPEGFYEINAFNPQSNFHLSLGVNYPNAVDLVRSGSKKPGGEIYIHGNCVTVGCIPLTDDKIKEVYVLAVEARNSGQQRIPVYLYPFRMNEVNFEKIVGQYPQFRGFWSSLKPAYQHFEKNKTLPSVRISAGQYQIQATK